jgi:hypothetical protein
MAVTIKTEEKDLKKEKFGNISKGEFFKCYPLGDPYMKIRSGTFEDNAYNLVTGAISTFSIIELVIPYNAEIIISLAK